MIEVIRFTAPWCGPCRMYKPQFEKAAATIDGVTFTTIDVDDDPDNISGQYGVRNIPFTAFLKNGEMVDKQTGVLTVMELTERINNL